MSSPSCRSSSASESKKDESVLTVCKQDLTDVLREFMGSIMEFIASCHLPVIVHRTHINGKQQSAILSTAEDKTYCDAKEMMADLKKQWGCNDMAVSQLLTGKCQTLSVAIALGLIYLIKQKKMNLVYADPQNQQWQLQHHVTLQPVSITIDYLEYRNIYPPVVTSDLVADHAKVPLAWVDWLNRRAHVLIGVPVVHTITGASNVLIIDPTAAQYGIHNYHVTNCVVPITMLLVPGDYWVSKDIATKDTKSSCPVAGENKVPSPHVVSVPLNAIIPYFNQDSSDCTGFEQDPLLNFSDLHKCVLFEDEDSKEYQDSQTIIMCWAHLLHMINSKY